MKLNKWFSLSILLLSHPFVVAENYQVSDWVADNTFTQGIEGPAVDINGNLFAVNFAEEGTIGIVDPSGNAKLYVKLPKGNTGNGIRISREGNMFVADYVGHNILKITGKDKTISIHAHNKEMNQPNDIAMMKTGVLFASDPNWKNSSGQLWRIDTDGTTHLLEKNMGTTNGIEVAPSQKYLYINESVQRRVWVYQINADNSLSNKQLLIQFDDFGLDGMRTDSIGNLYIARYGKGVIAKISPEGTLLQEINLKGKFPTNVAFGGKSGKQLFVTMQKRGAIETFSVEHSGAKY